MMRGMVIDMNDEQLRTLADLQGFLDGTMEVEFGVAAALAVMRTLPAATMALTIFSGQCGARFSIGDRLKQGPDLASRLIYC